MTGKTSGSAFDRIPLVLAVAVSTVWILFAIYYMCDVNGGLRGLSPTEAAALFAGIGGPLAALWLFIAVNEQARRLSLMSRGLNDMLSQHRHTLQLAETQTRALVSFQGQATRAQSAEARGLVLQDLAANAAVLAERLGVIRGEDIDLTWARFGSGDMGAFVNPFLTFAVSHPEISTRLAEAVAQDPLAAMAVQSYVRRFERLVAATDDKLVQDVLEEGALGRAFRLFKPAAGGIVAPTAPASSSAGDAPKAQTDLFPADDLSAQLADISQRLDAAKP